MGENYHMSQGVHLPGMYLLRQENLHMDMSFQVYILYGNIQARSKSYSLSLYAPLVISKPVHLLYFLWLFVIQLLISNNFSH